jgi:hypothetical protein
MLFPANLTSEEFSKIHNALYRLNAAKQTLDLVINPKLSEVFDTALADIRDALKNSYAESHQKETTRRQYYADVKARQNLKTTWGIMDITEGSFGRQFMEGDIKVYFGEVEPVTVRDPSMLMMWKAADQLWQQVGNQFRNEIVGFEPWKDGYRVLVEG